jgi:ABC-type sugar transport system ATPase subunit
VSPFAIEALEICKHFSGVPVLRGCDLRVRRGEIHALLGQNGAGKSTLMRILNGVHPRSSFEGQIWIDGRVVSFESPAHAGRCGVGYVPQEIEVIENLTVAENIFAGQMSVPGIVSGSRWVRWASLKQAARTLLEELGLSFDPSAIVASLSAPQRHLVMIARSLAVRPGVLILDEPTASLSSMEIERLFAVLRTLKARGTTMIYITHRLPEVLALCDRASVLRDGVIAEELEHNNFDIARFITAMSGFKMEAQFPERQRSGEQGSVLRLENFSVVHRGRQRVRDVSLELRRGEILGIAGLLGAGRSELLNAIYGYLPHIGTIHVETEPRHIRSPREARELGIALLTEDRKANGLLFNLPLRANISIGNLSFLSHAGIVRPAEERTSVLRMTQELKIKAGSPEATVSHLSGGNQQKVLFGRVLMRNPRILLLDEPTKGVDAGTRHEIYRLIADIAGRGVAVILVSSELEEVLGLADRVLVMADGRIVDEFPHGAGDEERVLRAVSTAQPWQAGVH